jgi:hypothetical protein
MQTLEQKRRRNCERQRKHRENVRRAKLGLPLLPPTPARVRHNKLSPEELARKCRARALRRRLERVLHTKPSKISAVNVARRVLDIMDKLHPELATHEDK